MIPFITHIDKPRQHVSATIKYSGNLKLDIWRPEHIYGPAPVLVFIPGGAWMIGHRRGQAHVMMSHLVERGWICVSIDYRTAPRNRWPAQIEDVAAALAWTRDNIGNYGYGGNPNFVAVAGASAGGHLASLAGLAWERFGIATQDRPDAVVALYGVFDWRHQGSPHHILFNRLLEQVVVGKSERNHPDIFRDASPIVHVRPDAPPFLIVQGSGDVLTPAAGARAFYRQLSAVSHSPVVYHHIPWGVHAFDLVHPGQAQESAHAVDQFLSDALGQHWSISA